MQFVEAHGARIPSIGLGTLRLRDDACIKAVQDALRLGYRHIDTAAGYLNERELGEGLRASGNRREDVFVTTKVPPTEMGPGAFERCVENSLVNLGLPWVDLLLIHWPSPEVAQPLAIKSLCDAKRRGLTRHIGVANFTVALLDEAMTLATEPLVTNQIEVHPFIDQSKVIAACRNHGIAVTAYAPMARGKALDNETLQSMAARHRKSVAQVMLRYLLELGFAAIPRTANPDHMQANIDVFDFSLSAAEMAELKKLNAANMRVVNPPYAPAWDA